MLTLCSRSIPGSVRTINEDSVVSDSALGLLAVADGMGGHNAGEVASRLALEGVCGFLLKSSTESDFTWPFGVDPAMSFNANRVMTAVKFANRSVFRASEERAGYTGMGSTLVAALFESAHFCFASVGDSRVYVATQTDIRQLSRDDSWVVMVAAERGVDAAALKKHPMRHVLTNVLGARSEIDVSVSESELNEGETLMLCSDGLHGAVPDEMILSILRSELDLERVADNLLETALARDGSDNISVALARYTADPAS